jgi:hypothetical protein
MQEDAKKLKIKLAPDFVLSYLLTAKSAPVMTLSRANN